MLRVISRSQSFRAGRIFGVRSSASETHVSQPLLEALAKRVQSLSQLAVTKEIPPHFRFSGSFCNLHFSKNGAPSGKRMLNERRHPGRILEVSLDCLIAINPPVLGVGSIEFRFHRSRDRNVRPNPKFAMLQQQPF
jgi:hypothetical protein